MPIPSSAATVTSASATRSANHLPLYLSLGLIGALVATYFLWPAFQSTAQEGFAVLKSGEQQRIAAWMHQFGYWGPVVVVLLMVVQMFLFVVNVVALILVAILAYGPWWGSLVALVGIIVASTVGYGLGHALGESFVRKVLGEKSEQKVLDIVQRYGVWAVVIARLSPALSDDAISFVAGVARMGYWKFMGATVAGTIPLIALLAYLGEESNRLKTGLLWVSGVSLLLFGGYVWWDQRRQKSQ
ncbi:TVP38/TMEM64 family protein [Hymenobacter sp. BT186]|uniref:TVP38/TMEM64 family membrane protein n=1 Tax=Hymenobacter telluris TaxID=2816474 RepID=A0A939EWQ4_9BACT|nr:TVP38/TMEM64 family protein [Hymenobacter telluris]MBO0358025.1 TVP38/TMEM64 family protein [Hymenobacter telluris]MBW3374052.1 TVP38/TMEM64 family protein [Hymenobacter norwichensis]